VFEEKKSVKEIIDEMRKELLEEKSSEPDPFEQLFSKKRVELATIKTKKRRVKKKVRAKKKAKKSRKKRKKR